MHIETLRLQNFKGLTTTLQCGKLNLLVGPNRAGKTAHGEAIQFAMRGHTNLGGTLEATQQLGGPTGCFVEATLDDGFAWARMIERKPRTGQLSSHVEIQGQEQLPPGRANAAVLEHVGDFAPMLDIGAFLNLSSDKRRDFVLSLCAQCDRVGHDPEAMWLDIVTEFCRQRLGVSDAPVTPDMLAEADHKALATIEKHIMAELVGDTGGPHLDGQPTRTRDLSASIAAGLDKAKEWANACKHTAQSASKAADVLAERRAEIQTIAETAEALRDRWSDLEARRDDLNLSIGRQEGSASSRKDIEHRLCDARTAHRNAGVVAVAVPSIAALNTQIAENEDNARTASARAEAFGVVTEDTLAEAHALWVNADRTACEQHDKCEAFQREIAQINYALKDIDTSPWTTANQLIITIIEEFKHRRDLAAVEPWITLSALIATRARVDAVDGLTKSRAAAKERYESASAMAQRADGKRAELFHAHGHQRDALEQITKHTRDCAQAVDAINALSGERDRLTRRSTDADADVLAKLEACTQLEHALRDLDADTGAGVNIDSLRLTRNTTVQQMATVQTQIDAKLDESRMVGELSRCVARAESERTMHEVAKGVADAIRVLRDRLMAAMVQPLLERIDRFVQVSAQAERAYCTLVNDKGRPVFELGVVVDDGATKVALPAMSGGQQCIFCTALLFALVDMAQPPLKLLIIELDRADSDTFMRIGDAIDATWRDDVQVFLLSHTYPKKAWDGWAVHTLTRGNVKLDSATPIGAAS